MMQRLAVLGATGSIGQSTLAVIRRHPERFQLVAASGHSNVQALRALVLEFKPRYLVVTQAQASAQLAAELPTLSPGTQLLTQASDLEWVAAAAEVDTLVAAIVGAAGLMSALAGARAGKTILLANKEALVIAGDLMMQAVREGGARLLPVDSEHNALFQCLPSGQVDAGVTQLVLTASGGPFREFSAEQLASVTPAQACAHPNWSMGQKISVDSATLMNKGLELIEACWLFGLPPERIEVLVHPQSIVHSMVRYADGSVLAQLGNPDMRTPIAHALAWPERIDAGVAPLDFIALARLDFSAPDEQRFPCLALARQAFITGGVAPAWLNAANEIAVQAFLDGQIGFMDIARINAKVLHACDGRALTSVPQLLAADAQARALATQFVGALA